MDNKELAQAILDNVGMEKNVDSVTHCVTRLRFVLKDDSKVDVKAIEALDGVMGTQNAGGQFQVILGGKVNKVYNALMDIANLTEGGDVSPAGNPDEENKNIFSRVLETLSAILIPSLPPVIGGGMIKGFLFMFWEFGWIEWGAPVFNLLNIMSDGMFVFYPFLLAFSAAKRFKTNPYMAVSLAGMLMHPTIYDALQAGTETGFKVLGINFPYLDYGSSVLPIILAVWIMSYVYRFFEERIPEIVSVIFTPMLTLIVMAPITLAVLGPAGYYIGEGIAKGVEWLIALNPIIAGFIIGALRPITVFTGTHHAVRAIAAQQLASNGRTTIGCMNYMSTMAQAAAPLAVYIILRKRNPKMADISRAAAISGFLGVTEPGLYGVIVKYKVAFLATTIGGGLGAAVSSFFNAAEYAMVMSSLVTIPATFGEGFIGVAIGLPLAIISTMLIIFVLKDKLIAEDDQQRVVLEQN